MKLYILQPPSKWQPKSSDSVKQNWCWVTQSVSSCKETIWGSVLGFLTEVCTVLPYILQSFITPWFYSEESPSQTVQKPKTNYLTKNLILPFLILSNSEIPLQMHPLTKKSLCLILTPIWQFFFSYCKIRYQYRWFYLCTFCAPFHSILFA